jgi:hypothetical protein
MKATFRYLIAGSDVVLDILSPDGFNAGSGDRLLREAGDKAETFALDGAPVRAVTPPYFLLLKLAAFMDRGEDLASAKDLEDIVCLATEVDNLAARVEAAGLRDDVAASFQAALAKHQADVSHVPDIVAFHLHPLDAHRRDLAVATLTALAAPQGRRRDVGTICFGCEALDHRSWARALFVSS